MLVRFQGTGLSRGSGWRGKGWPRSSLGSPTSQHSGWWPGWKYFFFLLLFCSNFCRKINKYYAKLGKTLKSHFFATKVAKGYCGLKEISVLISNFFLKWPDKCTSSYDMSDFKSYKKVCKVNILYNFWNLKYHSF